MRYLLLILFFLISLAGCAGKGVFHTIGRGETLWRICYTYDADMQEVAEINDIKDPTEIKYGSRIFIPGAREVKKVKPYSALPKEAREKEKTVRIVMDKGRFIWPVKGEVSSSFGMRNGTRHNGIDIRAPEGTEIKAADSGKVVFMSDVMRGYGNIIILKHKGDFYTVYAHNKKNLVDDGDTVEKGQVIATVGNTGNAQGHHLHFEVREGKDLRNPLFFLP